MNGQLLQELISRDTLLAVGVTLIFAGIVLRGLARGSRRSIALRKQHLIDERKADSTVPNSAMDRQPGWLERNFGLVANLVLTAGVALSLAGFLRN